MAPRLRGRGLPGPRWGAVTGYDETGDRLVVFGGETPEGRADTDVLVLENASGSGGAPEWRRIPVPDGPGPLAWAGGSYDPAGNRLVLFGGCGGSCDAPSGEAWVLEGADGREGAPRWTRLSASGPGPRLGAATAYDPARDRLFVFGGASGSAGSDLDDLWVLEGAARGAGPSWTALAASGDAPAPRRDAGLAFDASENRLILFGGRTSDGAVLDDVHALVLGSPATASSWRTLEPAGEGPAARFGAAVAYDPASRRLLVHGGSTGSVAEGLNYVFSDTWLLVGAGEKERPAWVPVARGGTVPAGRFSPLAAFSESARRLVVAGGANNKLVFPPDDLWLLADAFGQLPLVSAGQAGPDYLASEASSGDVFHWRVVTRDTRGAWRGSPAWRFTTNRPPSVDAGSDRIVDGAPASLVLAGAAADDGLPSSSSLEVFWAQVGGPGAVRFDDPASAATSATFDLPGSYVLRLTATDSQASASDEVVVEVRAANRAPLVAAGPDVAGLAAGATVTLQGSASDDDLPSGVLDVSWSQVSGPAPAVLASSSLVTTTASFPAAGTYVLRLTASDGVLSAHDDLDVVVSAVNTAPRVSAGPDRVLEDTQGELALEGDVSDDGLPGSPLTVLWTAVSGPGAVVFGDAFAVATAARFASPGRYVLRLAATDGELTSADEATVFVGASGDRPDLVVRLVDTSGLVVDPRSLAISGSLVIRVHPAVLLHHPLHPECFFSPGTRPPVENTPGQENGACC